MKPEKVLELSQVAGALRNRIKKSVPSDRYHYLILNQETILEELVKQVLDEINPKQEVCKMMMV